MRDKKYFLSYYGKVFNDLALSDGMDAVTSYYDEQKRSLEEVGIPLASNETNKQIRLAQLSALEDVYEQVKRIWDSQRGGAREGAGRKPIGDKPMVSRRIALSLPEEIWDKLDTHLSRSGMSLAAYVRTLVEDDVALDDE